MNKILYTTIFLCAFFSFENLYANCPGCVINVPSGLPADTLFLSDLPNGNANVYYDQDVSFRMPMTTTPVNANDPDIPAGLNISAISIVNITNLPPGLSWETDETSYDPQEETDGCIKFCGTPLLPGFYEIEITVEATVLFSSQEVSFPIDILIEPGVSNNNGFTLLNNSGCGSVTATFENNVPSNGAAGFNYQWDFGNGNSSIDENPFAQTYSDPGIYVVNYEATIDTVGYILTRVGVNDVECFDIPTLSNPSNNPDMHLEITDPNGVLIYESNTINNTDAPIEFFLNVEIAGGIYQLKVIDSDSGINGSDDVCAQINFNFLSSGVISNSEFELELDILHPVETVTSSDTIFVYEVPEQPTLTLDGEMVFCFGETALLSSSYPGNNQWFLNNEMLEGETESSLEVLESGTYQVQYTAINGCTSMSESIVITVFENPEIPVYENTNNLLSLLETIIYEPNIALQWYQDGVALAGETSSIYCAMESGAYGLEVIDLTTGCLESYALSITYDEMVNCATATEDFADEIDLKIYPNPVVDWINISFSVPEVTTVEFRFYDMLGRLHSNEVLAREVFNGRFTETISLKQLPAGMHFVELRFGEQRVVKKFIKN